jgi:ABC-2 type transport system permease protein
MNKILVIAKREFLQRVRNKAFLFGTIATPVILLLVWFFTGNLAAQPPQMEDNQQYEDIFQEMVGYVDRAGLIQDVPQDIPVNYFQSYGNWDTAKADLKAGEISALYLIPSDFRESGVVQRVSLRLPVSPPETEPFEKLLIWNLFPGTDPALLDRLRDPFQGNDPDFFDLTANTGSEQGRNAFDMLPFLFTFFILMPLFTGGGYLLQSLGKEKGEKVMEVLLVSVRPRHLLTGKLLGLGALVVIQYGVWLLLGGIAIALIGDQPLGALSGITGGELALMIPFAIGGFCLYAALMGGIGALAPDLEGGRTWTFLISLPMMIPLYLWAAITSDPQGIVAVLLSIFPFSAPVGMLLRLTTTAVPGWQIAASLTLLFLASAGTVWVMARLFRAQTLLSGEPLSLKRFWSAISKG